MPITIAIVEDSVSFRKKIVKLIESSDEFQCVCVCGNAAQALEQIPRAAPEVVLMDIQLPDRSGIECTSHLKALLPETQIMIFTVHEDSDQIFHALEMGASGYLLKRTPSEEIFAAIRDLHQGGAPMSSEIARKVVQFFRKESALKRDLQGLSPRQEELLKLLAKGHAPKAIADEMNVSVGTVRSYLKLIYQKLHVHSSNQALIKYFS